MADAPENDHPRPATGLGADSVEVQRRIEEGMPVVAMLARQLHRTLGRAHDVEELESLGREGLLHAARGFDPGKGVPFRRWANLRVRGAIIDGVRAQGALPRRVYQTLRALEASDRVHEGILEEQAAAPPATPEAADAKVGETLSSLAMAMAAGFLSPMTEGLEQIEDEEREAPDELAARKQLVLRVRRAIEKRPEAEKKLLLRHYFDDVTFDEAAREIGLSKSWASRLHARAIEALVQELRGPDEG